jgi:hypothetical protein
MLRVSRAYTASVRKMLEIARNYVVTDNEEPSFMMRRQRQLHKQIRHPPLA